MIFLRQVLFSLALLSMTSCVAEAASVIDYYGNSIKQKSTIEAVGTEDFGQRVSLLDGSFSMEATDVAIPTDAGTVTFGRTMDIASLMSDEFGGSTYPSESPSAPWDADVPYMWGVFPAVHGDWPGASHDTLARCSHLGSPPSRFGVGNFGHLIYEAKDFFSGIRIHIPSSGTESLKLLPTDSPRPSDSQIYKGVTSSRWMVSCLPSLDRGLGEGFRVRTPDGRIYYFNWLVSRPAPHIYDSTCANPVAQIYRSLQSSQDPYSYQACWESIAVPRVKSVIYATKVIDRFGHSITYHYSSARPWELEEIRSNGSTVMSMTYEAGRLRSVEASGRKWLYRQDATGALNEVVHPDGARWLYAGRPGHINNFNARQLWSGCQVNVGTRRSDVQPALGDTAQLSVTSPSGATAVFNLRRLVHGTRRGESNCYHIAQSSGQSVGPIVPSPSAYQVASLYKMVVTSEGAQDYVRNYSYSPGWLTPFVAVTSVTDSLGIREQWHFDTDAQKSYGKPVRYERGNLQEILHREDYTYLLDPQGHGLPPTIGWNFPDPIGSGAGSDNFTRPVIKHITTRQGVTFSWEVSQNCAGSYCFDGLQRPTRAVRSRSP